MELSYRVVELSLALPWATARTTEAGGVRKSSVVHVTLHDPRSGITGMGEAAPISRYHESAETVSAFLNRFDADALSFDRWPESAAAIAGAGPGNMSAKCALESALLDSVGKRTGKAVWQLLGVPESGPRMISYTIGIGPVEHVREQVRRARDFEVLKLKLGGPDDEGAWRALREVAPGKRVGVDANEGWRDREGALRRIEWLARDPLVEFVEQPLPAGAPEADHSWLRERSPLPVFADESCHRAEDLPRLAGGFHGINVKLMKAGGLREAQRTLHRARELGLRTMLGCMIESSLGIAAAFQLAALADHLDLDSHVLLTNDPFTGLTCERGQLSLAGAGLRIGLGVVPK